MALLSLALALLPALRPARAAIVDCRGFDHVAQEVWTLAREMDKAIQVTHVPKHYVKDMSNTFFAMLQRGVVEAAIQDCALGVATLAVFSLPESEVQFGLDMAREHYSLYTQLKNAYGHLWNSSGFSWGLETHQSASYPLLLGLQKPSCYGTDIKVYVYETDFAQKPLTCSQGMFATEVFVHSFFQHSACNTQNPDEADFFFVPVYAACVMTKEGKLAGDMDAFYKKLVTEQLPYFEAQGGRDHIFLWSSETYDFPSWLNYIHRSVFLSVEAQPIECTDFDFFSEETADNFAAHCQHCAWCMSPWKDMVIPGFVEKWSVRKMQLVEKSSEERNYTACYHGADSDFLAIYKYANTSVRNDLQTLRDLPTVSVGYRFAKIVDYFERIGRCHFCFVPKGLGFWSNRLYEVMLLGCIPVLLSDGIGLPFDDFLDWTKFSIKWPMNAVSPQLVEFLDQLLLEERPKVKAMHDEVRRVRCWLNYHSEDPSCSPYYGILKGLATRKQAAPRTFGPSWHRDAPRVRGAPSIG